MLLTEKKFQIATSTLLVAILIVVFFIWQKTQIQAPSIKTENELTIANTTSTAVITTTTSTTSTSDVTFPELKVGRWLELPAPKELELKSSENEVSNSQTLLSEKEPDFSQLGIKFPVPEGWYVDGTGQQIYQNPDEIDTCKIEFDAFKWEKGFEALKEELNRSIETMEDLSNFQYGEMNIGGRLGYFQDVTLPIGTSRAFYTQFNEKTVVVIVAYYNASKDQVCPYTWNEILKQIKWPAIQ